MTATMLLIVIVVIVWGASLAWVIKLFWKAPYEPEDQVGENYTEAK